MGENNSKWNNWQRINFQNIQVAHTTQYQKNKQPNQKVGKRPKQTFLQRRHTDGLQTWKDAQYHSLLEKCKSKPQWDITSHQSEWASSKRVFQAVGIARAKALRLTWPGVVKKSALHCRVEVVRRISEGRRPWRRTFQLLKMFWLLFKYFTRGADVICLKVAFWLPHGE